MSLIITKAGILDTIQDTGREGYSHLGIGPSGAMDLFSAQLANALLGKDLHAPVLELHFPAAVISFESATIITVTGGNFTPLINSMPCPLNQPVLVSAKSLLQFERPASGARCYVSILQDLQLDKWLGSYSTNLKAEAGGMKGRKLQGGDVIRYKNKMNFEKTLKEKKFMILPWRVYEKEKEKQSIRIMEGSAWKSLTYTSQKIILNETFQVSTASDRMVLQLIGEPLESTDFSSTLSTAVVFGSIQMLPDGQLMILMADYQTTGGYPQVAHVISADLPALAQKIPKSTFRFTFTDHHVAEMNFIQQIHYLEELKSSCNIQIQQLLYAHL